MGGDKSIGIDASRLRQLFVERAGQVAQRVMSLTTGGRWYNVGRSTRIRATYEYESGPSMSHNTSLGLGAIKAGAALTETSRRAQFSVEGEATDVLFETILSQCVFKLPSPKSSKEERAKRKKEFDLSINYGRILCVLISAV